jgi:hypothetical protein
MNPFVPLDQVDFRTWSMKNLAGSMTSVTSPSSLKWVMAGGILKREARPVPAIFK